MRNERISGERPLYSPGSTLPINNALPGNRWGFVGISPPLRTHLLFLLERHVGLSYTKKDQPTCNWTLKSSMKNVSHPLHMWTWGMQLTWNRRRFCIISTPQITLWSTLNPTIIDCFGHLEAEVVNNTDMSSLFRSIWWTYSLTVAYLYNKSNIIIHLESSLCPSGHGKSNIHSLLVLFLSFTESWRKYNITLSVRVNQNSKVVTHTRSQSSVFYQFTEQFHHEINCKMKSLHNHT